MAGNALPAAMIPVAGYTAMFKDHEDRTHSWPVVALQAADLPGDPPVAVCIGYTGRALPVTAVPDGWTLVGVVKTTSSCMCD